MRVHTHIYSTIQIQPIESLILLICKIFKNITSKLEYVALETQQEPINSLKHIEKMVIFGTIADIYQGSPVLSCSSVFRPNASLL